MPNTFTKTWSLIIREKQTRPPWYILSHLLEWLLPRREERNAGKNAEKREPLYTTGGTVNWYTTMEHRMEVPQKIKTRTSIWSSNSTSGNISERNQNTMLERYLHSPVYSSTIFNNQDM